MLEEKIVEKIICPNFETFRLLYISIRKDKIIREISNRFNTDSENKSLEITGKKVTNTKISIR